MARMFRVRCAAMIALLIVAGGLVGAQGQQNRNTVSSIESLIRSHQYDQALQATRSGLHDAPGDFRLWTLQGIILSIKGSNPEALNAFDKALRLSPNYAPA